MRSAGRGMKSLVIVADDIICFNAPVACRFAAHRAYLGHSSHCLGVGFLASQTISVVPPRAKVMGSIWSQPRIAIEQPAAAPACSCGRSLVGSEGCGVSLFIACSTCDRPPAERPAWH